MVALMLPLLKFPEKVQLPFYRLSDTYMGCSQKSKAYGCCQLQEHRRHEWRTERQENYGRLGNAKGAFSRK